MKFDELAFIKNRNFPGGPSAYLVKEGSFVPANLMSFAAYFIAMWMQDGFLVSLSRQYHLVQHLNA